MRLLVITQYFWPEDFRINELVSQLLARGHSVTVLTGKPNYPSGRVFPEFRASPAAYDDFHGAKIIRVPMLPRSRGSMRLILNYASFAIGATITGLRALRKERFDAMFVFEPSPVTVGVPAIALRARHGWPIAFWVLDQWPETLTAVGAVRSRAALAAVGALVRFIYRRCDVILAQSRGLVDQIRRYCDDRCTVSYFPNWAESGYRNEGGAVAPEVPDWMPGGVTIMFAGNIGDSQDFPAILDAAESLRDRRDIRWLVIGDGRAASWVREEATRRGIGDRFLMLGRFPQERMPEFFRAADALLVSLRRDPIFAMTIPGKIQSYLAFGRPILGMLDGEGARVIEDAKAGFVAPAGDSRGLADNVRRLADLSVADRAAMGGNAALYGRQEFDRDMLIDRLEQVLTEMAVSVQPVHARGTD